MPLRICLGGNDLSICNEIQLSGEILRKIAAVIYFGRCGYMVAYVSRFTSWIL
jgi:hypothetical protein